MAIWEYHLILVPRENKSEIEVKSFEELMDYNFSEDRQISFDFDSFLSPYFKKTRIYEEDDVWLENESKIEVNKNNNEIYEIRLTLDLRTFDKKILYKFLELAKTLDLLVVSILYEKVTILEPEINIILDDIRKSRAFKFAVDPNKFINDLTDNKEEAEYIKKLNAKYNDIN